MIVLTLLAGAAHAQQPRACAAQKLADWCSIVPAGPTASCSGCTNTYHIKSYQGSVRCLDYTPEVTGSAIFINDCAHSHEVGVEEVADGKHTVILHAGTKVIGIATKATNPVGGKAPVKAPALTVSDIPLQLEDVSTMPGNIPPGKNYFFTLDGDSIILASNRSLAAQVQNARGAVGSPIVLAPRVLADNEFWDFVATDHSAIDPTSGFVRVGYDQDPYCATPDLCTCRFFNVLSAAGPGTVVKLETSVDLTDCGALYVSQPGVTIRGNRLGTVTGPELRSCYVVDNVATCDTSAHAAPNIDAMISLTADDIRITGLRLHGPSRATDPHQPKAFGLRTPEANRGNIVDHNDISDWPEVAVQISGTDTPEANGQRDACSSSDPTMRPTSTFIGRNFIHHNEMQNAGYGIESYKGAYPFAFGNTFVSNRHAIAAGYGTSRTAYRAWYNLVLSAVPLQTQLAGIIWYHTHDFDMHGMDDGWFSSGYGGLGGDYVDVYKNTFLGRTNSNFELRGDPCHYIEFHNNISLEDKDDAVAWTICDYYFCGWEPAGPADEFRIAPNPDQFNHSNPTYGTKALGVGDFDGDMTDDLFLATGAAWYYSPAGKTEWRFLSAKTETIGALLFGDFDGDGRADVVSVKSGQLVVSWGGISNWEVLNRDPTGGRLSLPASASSAMTTGHFGGEHVVDIFWADGHTWWVSYGGRTPFQEIQTSGFRIPDLRFGDFNGDGKTDIFSVGRKDWQVSYAPSGGHTLFSSWQSLRKKLTDNARALVVADFDGDGVADVATDCARAGCWRISYGGQAGWHDVSQPLSLSGDLAGVGHFVSAKGTDVLAWNNANVWGVAKCDTSHGQVTQLCIAVAGSARAAHYSTQDMR